MDFKDIYKKVYEATHVDEAMNQLQPGDIIFAVRPQMIVPDRVRIRKVQGNKAYGWTTGASVPWEFLKHYGPDGKIRRAQRYREPGKMGLMYQMATPELETEWKKLAGFTPREGY